KFFFFMYFVEVFLLAFLFLFIFCLAVLLSFLPLIFLKQNYTSTKISSYECGFVPFSDVRLQFEINFYFIGVTFVLFDIDFSYLFPWIINFTDIRPAMPSCCAESGARAERRPESRGRDRGRQDEGQVAGPGRPVWQARDVEAKCRTGRHGLRRSGDERLPFAF